jgi:hypothetical protein
MVRSRSDPPVYPPSRDVHPRPACGSNGRGDTRTRRGLRYLRPHRQRADGDKRALARNQVGVDSQHRAGRVVLHRDDRRARRRRAELRLDRQRGNQLSISHRPSGPHLRGRPCHREGSFRSDQVFDRPPIRISTIAPPRTLYRGIRFFAAMLPCPATPRSFVARNAAGRIVAQLVRARGGLPKAPC